MPLTTAEIIKVFIPLAGAILFLAYPDQLLQAKDHADEKKRKRLKQVGVMLIVVALGYFLVALSGA